MDLSKFEFAIKHGAEFHFNSSTGNVGMTSAGVLTITLNMTYQLQNVATNLLSGPQSPLPVAFGPCGIFNKTILEYFQNCVNKKLFLDSQEFEPVKFLSQNDEVAIDTTAGKGNHIGAIPAKPDQR